MKDGEDQFIILKRLRGVILEILGDGRFRGLEYQVIKSIWVEGFRMNGGIQVLQYIGIFQSFEYCYMVNIVFFL